MPEWEVVMPKDKHFKKLENMYLSAPCNEYYSPHLTISEGAAEVTIPIESKFFHPAAAIHGSVYFKALDDAAFFAVNSLVEDAFVVTVSFNLHLLRPVSSGVMKAVGKVVHRSKSLFVAEAVAFNGAGAEVARGSGSFERSKISLSSEMGYGTFDFMRGQAEPPVGRCL
jgi:uncharacterized protein (TIGR00369 family)